MNKFRGGNREGLREGLRGESGGEIEAGLLENIDLKRTGKSFLKSGF